MTNMFKKSLVAIALAGVSTGAMAATVTSTATNVSTEWASIVASPANAPATVVAANLDITLGVAYTAGDRIKLTFSGESLDVTSLPGSVVSGPSPTLGVATLGFISSEVVGGNTVVTYRVTEVQGPTGADTVGAVVSFGDQPDGIVGDQPDGPVGDQLDGPDNRLKYLARELSGSVTVSFAAETAQGDALDTGGGAARSALIIRTGQQFAGLSADPTAGLSAVVDVNALRTLFVGRACPSATFTPAPSVYSVAGVATAFVPSDGYAVTLDDVDYALSGDFGFMLHPTTGEIPPTVASFTTACTTGLDVTANGIEVNCANAFDARFAIASGNTAVIPSQSFGLDAVVNYSLSETEVGSTELSRSAGTWGLNGSEVEVAYMPYSGKISQVINVTNRSGQGGDISVEAIAEDGTVYNLGVVAHAAPRTITRIAGEIQAALSNAVGFNLGTVSSTQRYALKIVTNAPKAQVEVYTAYNVDGTGARLVVNDSNGGGSSKK